MNKQYSLYHKEFAGNGVKLFRHWFSSNNIGHFKTYMPNAQLCAFQWHKPLSVLRGRKEDWEENFLVVKNW